MLSNLNYLIYLSSILKFVTFFKFQKINNVLFEIYNVMDISYFFLSLFYNKFPNLFFYYDKFYLSICLLTSIEIYKRKEYFPCNEFSIIHILLLIQLLSFNKINYINLLLFFYGTFICIISIIFVLIIMSNAKLKLLLTLQFMLMIGRFFISFVDFMFFKLT